MALRDLFSTFVPTTCVSSLENVVVPYDLPRRRRIDGVRMDDFGIRGSLPVSK